MEMLISTITNIWNGLSSLTIPIINMSFTNFLLAVLLVTTIIRVINIITGKHETGSGKD